MLVLACSRRRVLAMLATLATQFVWVIVGLLLLTFGRLVLIIYAFS